MKLLREMACIGTFSIVILPNVATAMLRIAAPLESELSSYNLRDGEIYIHESSNSLYWYREGVGAPIAPPQVSTPAGIITAYGGDTAPAGYLMCDGSPVSRTTYADLYAAIGTSFGEGNGTTTFNVPDLRGRFLRGVDNSAGRDPDLATRTAMNTGGNAGDNVGSVQDDAFKSHLHGSGTSPNYSNGNGNTNIGTRALGTHSAIQNNANQIATTSTGGTETRPKNANVNFIIKI